jgi:hypothetical protein
MKMIRTPLKRLGLSLHDAPLSRPALRWSEVPSQVMTYSNNGPAVIDAIRNTFSPSNLA